MTVIARGIVRLALPKGVNKLETMYATTLEALKKGGAIHDWGVHRITLKLADDTRYTPDFDIVHNDGTIEFRETKGFMRDDAGVKLKVAAKEFPHYRFTLVTRDRKLGWQLRNYTYGESN